MNVFELFATVSLKDEGLTAGIKKASDAFSSFGKEADKQTKTVSEVRSEIMKLAATYEKEGMTKSDALKKAHSELSSEMEKAKASSDKVAGGVKNLGDAFGKVKDVLGGVGAGISAFNDVANKVVGVISKVAATAGTALSGLAAAGVKVGMDFEKEMSNLAAITEATTDEMQAMEIGIRDVSVSTGTSLMDIAKNAKMLAEAGGDVDLMMEQLTHGTNLANATQTDMATTLDFLGSTMKTFGIEAEDTQSVVDSFALVASLANVELGQLSESYVNVGGSAANAGLGIDDLNAMLITLSNAGLKGGAAGTSLNAVLRNLATPTDKAAAELERLGIALYDSEGHSRDTMTVMQELEGALGGMEDEQRNRAESIIFDSVTQKGWNMLVLAGMENIADLSSELTDSSGAFDGLGQAAGMAATRQDNLAGIFDKLKTSVTDLGVEFYQNVDNPLKDIGNTALEMVGQLSTALKEGGLEGLVTAVGDVLAQAVQFIVDQAPQFVDAAKNLIVSLVKGLTENKDSILAGARDTFQMIIDGLKEILPMLVPLANDVINELINGFIEYEEMIYTTGVDIFTQLLEGLAENFPELVEHAKEAVMNIANGLAENLPKILQAGIDIILELIRGISDILPELIPVAIDIILALVDTLLENLDEIIMVALELILALAEGIINALPELAKEIPRIIKTVVENIVSRLTEIIDVALQIIESLVYGLIDALPELILMVPKIIIAINEGLIANLDKIIDAAFKIILALTLGLVEALPELIASIPKIGQAIIDTFKEMDWLSIGKNIIDGLINGVKGMANAAVEAVKGVGSAIWNGITGLFGIHSPSVLFRDKLGKMMMEGMAIGIDEGSSKVQKATEKMAKMTYDSAVLWIKDYRNSSDYLKTEEIAMWEELATQLSWRVFGRTLMRK